MYATYHLSSVDEIDAEILQSIRSTFKSKPITIIVEEDEVSYELTAQEKSILDERLEEDVSDDLSAEESLDKLHQKYGI